MDRAATSIPATLDALRVPLDGLVPYGQNPRRGNVDVIVESLERHGQYRPIVVRAKTFEVLAGNHTLAAAKELGWTEIAATFVDVTDDEAARIVLVDNRAADLGSYDDELLLELLEGLASEEDGLRGVGYGQEDLDDLRRHLDNLAMTEAANSGNLGEDPDVLADPVDLDGHLVNLTVVIEKEHRSDFYAAMLDLPYVRDTRDSK